jgi:NADPH:quinone reductase-like Zn-dependent oxidoreductase
VRAVVHDKYGGPDVLRLDDVDTRQPEADEVLIKVFATTVNRTDCGVRSGKPVLARPLMQLLGVGGLFRPKRKILGSELAGEVEALGASVSEFKVGDRVFGVNAGLYGAHAEYVCMRESAPLAPMPVNMTFNEAAAVCDGVILALMALREADLRPGRSILIYGASGSMGTAGVQLAKYFGADVTAVTNTKNLEIVRSLGADRVIDYTMGDFTKSDDTFDVIYDAVGKISFARCKSSLKPGGIYLATDGLMNIILALVTSRFGDKKVKFPIPPRYTKKDVLFLKELIETGKYRAVIDRTYPLEQVVEATRYVETEQKTGNVVLTVGAETRR